jgi:hypothetical protein
MFRHVVLIRWKLGTTAAQRTEVRAALQRLPDVITTLRSYEIGEDVGVTEGNADLAIVADFDDVAGYETYRDHPEHQRVLAELIRPLLETRTAVQHHR